MGVETAGLLGILITQLASIVIVWLKLRSAQQHVENVANVAKEAREFSRPTGNGFAAEVFQELADIKKAVKKTKHTVDRHIDAHVSASMEARKNEGQH